MSPGRIRILIGVIEACLKSDEEFILLVHSGLSDETELLSPKEMSHEQTALVLEGAAKTLRMKDNPEKN